MNRLRIILTRGAGLIASLWLVRLTLAGKFVVVGTLLSVVATAGVNLPTYQLFSALVLLLFASLVVGLIWYPRITVTGEFPAKATAGHKVYGQFTITNRSRRKAYDIELGLFHLQQPVQREDANQSIPVLAAGESITVTVALSLKRRGLYHLREMLAYSTFPFNLFRLGRARQELASLLVLPSFHPLASLDLPQGTRFQPGGVALSSHVGESPEYIGSREYVPGESTRRMDYRAWARLGVPAVREFQEEYYRRVGIVMDSYVPRWRKGGPYPLNAVVGLTAAVAETLSRGETLINVFAAGPEMYVFESGRHIAHLENVLEVLACIDPCRKSPYDNMASAVVEQLERISATVCIFLDWDKPRRTLAQSVVESGSHLKLIFVRNGETSEPFDESEFDDVVFLTPAAVLEGKVDEL